jgi:(2Fe-2S) ferredoxin
MVRVQHHLLLCATPSRPLCGDPEVGAASWQRLKSLVKEMGLEDPHRSEGVVLRTKADCLRICRDGPILLIWPEGILYQRVRADRIERILRQHVIEGRPVEEWILRRTPFRTAAPAEDAPAGLVADQPADERMAVAPVVATDRPAGTPLEAAVEAAQEPEVEASTDTGAEAGTVVSDGAGS